MAKQVPCDYCGVSNDSKTIFSAQKSFVGHKILDVLEIVTHKDLPGNLALKICFLCASNLMSTMGVIEKTQKLVENATLAKSAAATKNKKAGTKTDEPVKSIVDQIDIIPEAEVKSAKPKSTPVTKNATLRQRSKSMASRPSDLIFPKSPAKKLDEVNASLSKMTPKKNTSHLENSLDDSVRLTPAKEVSPNKKVFLQLFGSRNVDADAPESEDEDEDDNAVDENAEKVIAIKSGFDCKLCDFQSRAAKQFKEHLFKEHGQQRPRIYFCDLCPKSFGILKSWRVHIEKVHGVTVEAPKKVVKAKEQQTKDSKKGEVKSIDKSPQKEAKANVAKANEQETKDSEEDDVKTTQKSPQKEAKGKVTKAKDQQTKDSEQDVVKLTARSPQKEAKGKVTKAKDQQNKDSEEDEVKTTQKSPQKQSKAKVTNAKEQHTKNSEEDEVRPTEKSPQKEAKAKVAKAKEQQTKDSEEDEVRPTEKIPQKEAKAKTKDSKEDEVKPTEKSPRKAHKNAIIKEEVNEEIMEISQGPKLATIKALNGDVSAKKKWLENVISNADYTFDVNGSSASTPKAADISIDLGSEFRCDICDSELATAKQMQEHMKTAHGIEKPKIFKCPVCDKGLTTKQTLKHHMNLHSESAGAAKSTKRKILQEEKEIDIVDSIAPKSPPQEDDEEPQEKKILHTEEEIAIITEDESVIMAPPKAVGKKPKKAKDSSNSDTLGAIDISDSPSKKGKRKNKEEASLNDTSIKVDFMDEINTNVKPHKRARLQSASDSFCSSIDDYSTTEESLLSCSQCGKQVKSKQRLMLHIQKRHGTKLECPECKTNYGNQRDYVNHFAVCSSGGPLLRCGVSNCKKSFYEGNYLSTHLRVKHQWV
ncbi:zinc finger protein CG2199 [Drosophila serrata]|uniref:zinc finger protein CG2199 n=1 Tax=Drosophila serrata TaxID=7274 RepID=UPI000A1D017E|nr:zinc finger protein CG2199 [Drosophila serrata]